VVPIYIHDWVIEVSLLLLPALWLLVPGTNKASILGYGYRKFADLIRHECDHRRGMIRQSFATLITIHGAFRILMAL
jgi:hypothetical protein